MRDSYIIRSKTAEAGFKSHEFAGNPLRMNNGTMAVLALLLFGCCLVAPTAGRQSLPVLVFGNKQFSVGMPEDEAIASLATCCRLSPSVKSDDEKSGSPAGAARGHFIFSKGQSPGRILGTIYFSGGRVVRVTRPLDDNLDSSNDDVVAFARAISEALSPTTADAEITARVSVRHERLGNGASDVLSLSLPDGRGIQIDIGTLDKPDADTNKRDFVSLDETLEPPKPE